MVDIIQQLEADMRKNGVNPHGTLHLNADGTIYRFPTENKPRHKNGWCALYEQNKFASAVYGDWALSNKGFVWYSHDMKKLSSAELHQIKSWQNQAVEQVQMEKDQRYVKAASTALKIWDSLKAAEDHPYLTKKKIQSHVARIKEDYLIIPVYDIEGTLTSLQYIDSNGNKKFLKGGKIKGCMCPLGKLDQSEKVYVAEGFATAASIFEASDIPTVCAFSAGNLADVSKAIKAKYPDKHLTIVADNDENGHGQEAAEKASEETGARVIVPPDIGDANDYANSGKDLAKLLATHPINKVKIKRFIDLQNSELVPRKWFLDEIFTVGLNVIGGKKGTAKSFMALQVGHAISNGIEFLGRKVIKGKVLYISTELDEADLRERANSLSSPVNPEFEYMTDSLTRGLTSISEIMTLVKERRYDVVIIDMLTGLLDEKLDTNSYSSSLFWNELRMKAKENNCCIIGLWHSPKSLNTHDHVDRLIGSVGIGNQCDSIVTIDKKRNENKAIIEVTSNHSAGLQLHALFTDDLRWVLDPKQPVSVLNEAKNFFEKCWIESGQTKANDKPYLDRSDAVKNSVKLFGKAQGTASKYWQPSGIWAKALIDANLIKPYNNGYIVTNADWGSRLMLLSK